MSVAAAWPSGLFRHRPELYGLDPDAVAGRPLDEADEVHYQLNEARRTLTFWLCVTGGGVLMAAFGTGLLFHHFSIMAENGVGRSVAASMFAAFGLSVAAATLLTGFLMDRVLPRFLLSAALAFMVAAMLVAPTARSTAVVLGYGVLLGAMQGMNQAIQASVHGHYFGRLNFASIKGMATTIMVAGTAAGPLIVAWGFDVSGSYQPVLWVAALLPLTLSFVAPFLPLKRDGRVL